MRVDGLFLAGIGACVPPPTSAADAVARGEYDADEYARSGWTGAADAGDTPAPDLAVTAAREAMAMSGHEPGEIDLVLHASSYHQGPEGWSPAHYVQHHAVGGDAPALELRQTCNGMWVGVDLAACYLAAVPGRTAALITGADNFNAPLISRWRYASGLASGRSSIFGDGGTALVLSRRAGFAELLSVCSGSIPELEEIYRGDEALFPPAATVGRELRLGERMAAYAETRPGLLSWAASRLAEVRTDLAKQALAEAGLAPDDITRATHVFAGDVRHVRQVLEPIGIPAERGLLEFGRARGHLGVNDHVAGLHHLVETAQVTSGDHVLIVSNGAGTGLTCAVVRIS